MICLLIAIASKFDGAKGIFPLVGMADLVNAGESRRLLAGSIFAVVGGLFASVWVWAIQRQEIVGTTSLCAEGSGCAIALSSHSVNTIPFTDMMYGLFFTLWFSILLFFSLSVHLEPGWKKSSDFMGYAKWMSLLGSIIAIIMLATQQLSLDGNPICILCLLLLAATTIQFILFSDLVKAHDDGSWSIN